MRSSFGIGVFLCAGTVVLAGIVAGAGCTVLTNDGPPDDAGVFEGGDASSPVCASCLANECTGPWAVCLTDPGCLALAKRAGGAACEADAGAEDGGTDPLAAYAAFTACTSAKASSGCATDCAGSTSPAPCASDAGAGDAASDGSLLDATDDAGDAGDDAGDAGDGGDASMDASTTAPVTASVDACASCVSGTCGDAKKSCAIGTECAAYLECAHGAANAAAADDCGRQHATGKTAAVDLATCTRVGCSEACGF